MAHHVRVGKGDAADLVFVHAASMDAPIPRRKSDIGHASCTKSLQFARGSLPLSRSSRSTRTPAAERTGAARADRGSVATPRRTWRLAAESVRLNAPYHDNWAASDRIEDQPWRCARRLLLGNSGERRRMRPTVDACRLRLWPMTWALRVAAVLAGTLAPLVLVEILLRLHPASYEGARLLPVDDGQPIARLQPNREFTWSRDWNFSIVNTVQVNNAGFRERHRLRSGRAWPSPRGYRRQLCGGEDGAVSPHLRWPAGDDAGASSPGLRLRPIVGAPLSQYLSWAAYARDAFQPNGLIVVIIENDYDKSLIEYHSHPGYHHFVERDDGRLDLARVDYAPSLGYRLAQRSALARYLVHNLRAPHAGRVVFDKIMKVTGVQDVETRHPSEIYRTSASVAPLRVAASKRAVDAFLDLLPEYSGLQPERIAFVVDGMRPSLYDAERLGEERGSYRDVMRRYFMANADQRGYETIDMQPLFIVHYREHRQRFEWPQDPHWNALGHEQCFKAAASSAETMLRAHAP